MTIPSLSNIATARSLSIDWILVWMGLPVANTLDYYDTANITTIRSFIVLDPGANILKLFYRGNLLLKLQSFCVTKQI
jgi:hypothetical protein